VASEPSIRTPIKPVPEMTLPAPAAVPPIVLRRDVQANDWTIEQEEEGIYRIQCPLQQIEQFRAAGKPFMIQNKDVEA
jgi:hypothetical protein